MAKEENKLAAILGYIESECLILNEERKNIVMEAED